MKILAAILLSLSATAVWAACTSHSYTINGKTVYCMTCCYAGGNCNTTCN
jgi:hypothetical protein